MARLRWVLWVASFALVFAAPAAGQQAPPLVTDRPDQTESAEIVPVGFVQFELGGTFTEEQSGPIQTRVLVVPGMLVRIGVHPRVEARLGFAGWQRESIEGGIVNLSQSGVGDLNVGFKVRALDARGPRPDVAFIGTVGLPTGENGFGADRAEPAVRLAFAQALTSRVSLGYNVGAAWVGEPDGFGGTTTETDLLYTVVLGTAVAENVGAFFEAFGTIALGTGRESVYLLDGGLTFGLRPNVQLDLAGGIGLNDAAEDWFVGAGLSVRVPR